MFVSAQFIFTNSFAAFLLCVILDLALEAVLPVAVKVVPWAISGPVCPVSVFLAPADSVSSLAPPVLKGCDFFVLVLFEITLLVDSCNSFESLAACLLLNSGGRQINVVEGYFCWILLGDQVVDFSWKGHPEKLHFEEVESIVYRVVSPFGGCGIQVSPVSIVVRSRYFVAVGRKAILDDPHCLGNLGWEFTGGFVGFHGQVGKAINEELVICLSGKLVLEPGF